jgi:hypothetical protein
VAEWILLPVGPRTPLLRVNGMQGHFPLCGWERRDAGVSRVFYRSGGDTSLLQ